jgi:hypothetical protein
LVLVDQKIPVHGPESTRAFVLWRGCAPVVSWWSQRSNPFPARDSSRKGPVCLSSRDLKRPFPGEPCFGWPNESIFFKNFKDVFSRRYIEFVLRRRVETPPCSYLSLTFFRVTVKSCGKMW